MAAFSRRLAIDSAVPLEEAWRRLLPVVKTDLRFCANCGQPQGPPPARPELFEGRVFP